MKTFWPMNPFKETKEDFDQDQKNISYQIRPQWKILGFGRAC